MSRSEWRNRARSGEVNFWVGGIGIVLASLLLIEAIRQLVAVLR